MQHNSAYCSVGVLLLVTYLPPIKASLSLHPLHWIREYRKNVNGGWDNGGRGKLIKLFKCFVRLGLLPYFALLVNLTFLKAQPPLVPTPISIFPRKTQTQLYFPASPRYIFTYFLGQRKTRLTDRKTWENIAVSFSTASFVPLQEKQGYRFQVHRDKGKLYTG